MNGKTNTHTNTPIERELKEKALLYGRIATNKCLQDDNNWKKCRLTDTHSYNSGK